MQIKNLTPRLAEKGKIKVGGKGEKRKSQSGGEWQAPVKYDHFVVTTLDRDETGNFCRNDEIHGILGSDKPRRIPVRLLFNDIELNLMSRYAAFIGRTMWCAGDGETAQRLSDDKTSRVEVQCPCHRLDSAYQGKDKCKINGALSVVIDGVPGVGNVWTFRTTSWNSVVNLMSSMQQIMALSGGVIAGLPLDLVLAPKEVTAPDGKVMRAWVVSLEYRGTIESLRDIAYRIATADVEHTRRMKRVEDDVRRRLALPAPVDVPLVGDDPSTVAGEFYSGDPDEHAAPPPRPRRADYEVTTEEPASEPASEPSAFTVVDLYGQVVYQGDIGKEALNALRKLTECATPSECVELIKLNRHMYPAGGSLPTDAPAIPGVAVPPSDAGASRPAASAEPPANGSRVAAPSLKVIDPRTKEVRMHTNIRDWCAAMRELGEECDPYDAWDANSAEHVRLMSGTRNDAAKAELKAVTDYYTKLCDGVDKA